MGHAPHVSADPLTATTGRINDADAARAALRSAGPLVRVDAEAGGYVWIVTDEALARKTLMDPRIVKDPAYAPEGWDQRTAGLEPTAHEQPSLTTLDGRPHAALRRAHAPLFSAKRMAAGYDRMTVLARELLTPLATAEPVDLTAEFTQRYPVTVLMELLGVPPGRVDEAVHACRLMFSDYPAKFGAAMAIFFDLAASAVREGRNGLAAELRDRLPEDVAARELNYHLFGLIFAGQTTTDAALGFLIANLLGAESGQRDESLERSDGEVLDSIVQETLRRHPPAPFSLWRFTSAEIEIDGVVIPARSPVLVDIQGINTHLDPSTDVDLTFGAGPHYCLGAQLAKFELRAVAEVIRTDFPHARLAVPFDELWQANQGGITAFHLTSLPVILR